MDASSFFPFYIEHVMPPPQPKNLQRVRALAASTLWRVLSWAEIEILSHVTGRWLFLPGMPQPPTPGKIVRGPRIINIIDQHSEESYPHGGILLKPRVLGMGESKGALMLLGLAWSLLEKGARGGNRWQLLGDHQGQAVCWVARMAQTPSRWPGWGGGESIFQKVVVPVRGTCLRLGSGCKGSCWQGSGGHIHPAPPLLLRAVA